jgi:hypothetical protein
MGNFGPAATLNLSAVAVAAAHGITQRTIATWNPGLARTPRVLVPIQLDALVVRPQDKPASWADCKMQAPPSGQTSTRKSLLPPPFKNLDATRGSGVYLHWALPDGLTHGSDTGSAVSFPAIPDRWLILRFYPSTIGPERRAVKGWVLRAVDQNPVAVDLDQWKETGNEPGATDPPLTAVGFGDPAWATYYDNVANRLAFYDSLADISSGPLAYLVCGWYSDPSFDPLGSSEVHSLTDFDRRMAQLGWELKPNELHEAVWRYHQFVKASTMLGLQTREAVAVGSFANAATIAPAAGTSAAVGRAALTTFLPPAPAATVGAAPSPLDPSGHPVDDIYTTDGSWWPELTLYHGSAVGIGWPGIGWPGNENGLLSGEVGGPPPASGIQVAVGNTMSEALAVLVARANNAPDEARLLEAFMLGGLRDLEQPDGQARVDALLHASAFASRDGGYVEEQIPQQALPPSTPPVPQGSVTPDGPGIFKQPSDFTPGKVTDLAAVEDTSVSAVSRIGSQAFVTKERFSEISILKGGLSEAVHQLGTGASKPGPGIPAQNRTVKRALPRLFQPSDPVILVQGGGRSFKHGGDGRFAEDGKLACRLTGFCVTELSCSALTGQPNRPAVRGDDLLERGVENGSVPPECEDLLRETVLFDPGASMAAARSAIFVPPQGGIAATTRAAAAPVAPADLALARNFTVEQTVWWATRDPRVDPGPLVARSGIAGTLPSPIAVTLPVRPWTPIHLDWRIQFIPSANGVADWTLDETDFDPGEQKLPSPDDTQSGIIMEGRVHLTGGAASTIAQGIRTALAQAASAAGSDPLPANGLVRFNSLVAQTVLTHFSALAVETAVSLGGGAGGDNGGVPAVDRSVLGDIASTLENMDVLSGALDNFHTGLRGGYVGDGKTVPPQGSPAPSPFVPMRAGFMRILRLRLVDGFGQVADLAGSSESTLADSSKIVKSQPIELPASPQFEVLPPRFTSPARLWFRYTAADGSATDAGSDVSPVCGYVMPNHLDGDLEFFDVDGTNLGVVRPDSSAGIIWEEAPGRPSTVGQTPARAIPNQFLGGMAQGLIDWGLADAEVKGAREDALSALLRIIDSTLWAVDPFGHTGDEHLALLVGHPVVVLRARVCLEVEEPISPDVVNRIAVPLRLGALTHWQDGLLGYFVNDDYRTLYCADAAVAGFAREVGPNRGFLQQINLVPDFYQTFSDDLGANVTKGNSPVNHPYVDDSGVRLILPNQEVQITLLVEPQTVVHATAGLLPRKEIGMRREWIAAALAKLAPTFRFGPVLVDPKRIRMPVATELAGTWTWDARADVSNWKEDPVINATTDAILPPDPARGTEGWLRLQSPSPPNGTAKT